MDLQESSRSYGILHQDYTSHLGRETEGISMECFFHPLVDDFDAGVIPETVMSLVNNRSC